MDRRRRPKPPNNNKRPAGLHKSPAYHAFVFEYAAGDMPA